MGLAGRLHYNEERTNQGRHCQGRTPMETFVEGLPLYEKYVQEGGELTEVSA